MLEGWMGRGSKIDQGNGKEPVTKLDELKSRRGALMKWMDKSGTPDDVRLLDDLDVQIQALEKQPVIQE